MQCRQVSWAPQQRLLEVVLSPQLIVGILAFAIGVLTLLLPETLGKPLTSTLEEAEALASTPGKKSPQQQVQEMRHSAPLDAKADGLVSV